MLRKKGLKKLGGAYRDLTLVIERAVHLSPPTSNTTLSRKFIRGEIWTEIRGVVELNHFKKNEKRHLTHFHS